MTKKRHKPIVTVGISPPKEGLKERVEDTLYTTRLANCQSGNCKYRTPGEGDNYSLAEAGGKIYHFPADRAPSLSPHHHIRIQSPLPQEDTTHIQYSIVTYA